MKIISINIKNYIISNNIIKYSKQHLARIKNVNKNILNKWLDYYANFVINNFEFFSVSQLSCNPNLTIKIIKAFPNEKWECFYILKHKNINESDLDYLKHIVNFYVYIYSLQISQNPNITLNYVLQNKDIDWNYHYLSHYMNITINDVINNPDFPWNYEKLSFNINISQEDTCKLCDKPWCYIAFNDMTYSMRYNGYTLRVQQIYKLLDYGIITSLPINDFIKVDFEGHIDLNTGKNNEILKFNDKDVDNSDFHLYLIHSKNINYNDLKTRFRDSEVYRYYCKNEKITTNEIISIFDDNNGNDVFYSVTSNSSLSLQELHTNNKLKEYILTDKNKSYGYGKNKFTKSKFEFILNEYKKHMAAYKIQNRWKNARLNPYCKLGINKINRDMDISGLK